MKKTKKKRASTSKTKKRGARRSKSKSKSKSSMRASTAKRPGKRTTLASMKPKSLHFWFKTRRQASAFVEAAKPLLKSLPVHPAAPTKGEHVVISIPHHALKKGFNPAGELRSLAKERGALSAETRYA